MKLVLIIGSGAVGKMTVGQHLAEKTGLKLFHGHMTIEPVIELFGEYNQAVTNELREVVFTNFAKSDNYGIIFTYMWAFDQPSDREYILHVADIFKKQGAEIYCVELVAPQEVRLQRNSTENRLQNKASKRDLDFSENRIRYEDDKFRLESREGEIPFENYLKIDNTNLSPDTVADMICEKFHL